MWIESGTGGEKGGDVRKIEAKKKTMSMTMAPRLEVSEMGLFKTPGRTISSRDAIR